MFFGLGKLLEDIFHRDGVLDADDDFSRPTKMNSSIANL